jgi:hypothetical protein
MLHGVLTGRRYDPPVSEEGSQAENVDVAALFAQLQDEVRRSAPHGAEGGSAARLAARGTAERLWPVSTDRHLGGRAGVFGAIQRPVKVAVRKLARWYVEPVFADQRGYNDALLKLVDELAAEVDRLRARVDELESR